MIRATPLILLLAAGVCFADDQPIDRAFSRLYNFDFPNAHSILDRHLSLRPDDPLGYAVKAAALLFAELDRLQILESEFFADDKRIIARKKLQPDPAVRSQFFAVVQQAQQRAHARLASHGEDKEALFTLCVVSGLVMDYTSLIEKKQLGSLSLVKQAHRYAVRLQRIDPNYYDAYLSTGVSEYILGSLPRIVRWFFRFDNTTGDKTKAIENLQLVASSGRYLKPFAKILLAIVHLREKQPAESRRLLVELSSAYPQNPLFKKELAKITHLMESSGAAPN